MNSETYVECGVKKKNQTDATWKRGLLILGCFVCLFILPAISWFLVPVSGGFFAYTIYEWPRLNIEWEYVYVDGQIDFDKIMGKVKRKNKLRIDLSQVEVVAPLHSHELDSYQNKNMKVKNFTSGDRDVKPYVMIGTYKEELVKIYFEPNDKMKTAMKLKAPRKVFEC